MTPTLEASVVQPDAVPASAGERRLTAAEIARRMGVTLNIAWDAVRIAVDAGYLDRDEFGTYAPWCEWPRIGF